MSFSYQVKKELYSLSLKCENSIAAEICGIFLFNKYFKNNNSYLYTEDNDIFEHVKLRIDALIDKNSDAKNLYGFKMDSKNKRIYPPYHLITDLIPNLKPELYSDFLRGVFISCGSIVNPKNEYHLELNIGSTHSYDYLTDIFKSCKALEYVPKVHKRREQLVIYLKESEKIIDFVTFIGASKCAMDLIQIKMLKEVRNNINRTINFETANISKITQSSTTQIKAIKKIKNTIGIDSLPESLRETALLRLNNPYMSLKELTKLYKAPISKSGINHRLNKIINMSNSI